MFVFAMPILALHSIVLPKYEAMFITKGSLNSPITMGHTIFLEALLIFLIRINIGYVNIQPMLNFLAKKLS